jgi:hypothetical protein
LRPHSPPPQGIKKLRALHAESESQQRVLWRGMRSVKVAEDFMKQVFPPVMQCSVSQYICICYGNLNPRMYCVATNTRTYINDYKFIGSQSEDGEKADNGFIRTSAHVRAHSPTRTHTQAQKHTSNSDKSSSRRADFPGTSLFWTD